MTLEIDTADQFDAALEEIVTIERDQLARADALRREIETAEKRHQRDADPAAERIEVLKDALERYSAEHRRELFGRAKSTERLGAKLGWQRGQDRVDFADGEDARSVLDSKPICDLTRKLLRHFRTVLARLTSKRTIEADCLCDVKVSLSRTKALAAYQSGQLGDRDLERLGLQFVPGEDRFFVRPQS